jgi:Ca2+/Na+ antiporter
MTAAGTVYASATGGAAVSGATVTITGSNGTKITLVTGSAGSFYTSSAISFPAKVEVSKCPDISAMPATINSGDCNSCHTSSTRIHLP